MLLTKFSNRQIIHTGGTILTVADMLSQDFLHFTTKVCHLQHNTLPPHIEFIQLKSNNSLKQIHYLVEPEDVLPTQKNESHPNLVDHVDDQFTLHIQDESNTVTCTPLDSFSFQSVSSFLNESKKSITNKTKTLLQQNPLSKETEFFEYDDPVNTRNPPQNSQSPQPPHTNQTLLSESKYPYFDDSHFSQNIFTNMTNSLFPISDGSAPTNAIIQSSIKPTSTQSLPLFDPSFFAHCEVFEFFLPSNTFLTMPILP